MTINSVLFYIVAFISRGVQGFSNACVSTSCYSMFCIYFQKDIMKANTLFKISLIMGIFIGLIVGMVLNMIGGYFLPYASFSISFLFLIPYLKHAIPDDRNDVELSTSFEEHNEALTLIRNRILFKKKRISGALMVAAVSMAIVNFGPAVLSQRLLDLGATKDFLPVYFSVPMITPLLSVAVVFFLSKFMNYRAIILLSFPIVFLALAFTGPSQVLRFQE